MEKKEKLPEYELPEKTTAIINRIQENAKRELEKINAETNKQLSLVIESFLSDKEWPEGKRPSLQNGKVIFIE